LPACWLGGTLAAFCCKAGSSETRARPWHEMLRCPDCRAALNPGLACPWCGYAAPEQEGVYNLLPTPDKRELYPGPRADIIDFNQAPADEQLLGGFSYLEGTGGNLYRWIGPQAAFRLGRTRPGPMKLRICGHASERFAQHGRIIVHVNDAWSGEWRIRRPGVFVLETPVTAADCYRVTLDAEPAYYMPPDVRPLTVTLSLMRLTPADPVTSSRGVSP